jgi:uncharacterized protein YkwD
MNRSFLFLFIVKAIFLFFITTNCFPQTELDINIFNLVNEYRKENKLREIIWDTILTKVSKNQAEYMSASGNLSHDQLNEDSAKFKITKDFATKFIKQGINFNCSVFENCGVVFNSDKLSVDSIAKSVVAGWKKSLPHNEILLSPILTNVGISHSSGYYYKEFYINESGDLVFETIECEMEWVSLNGYGIK